MARKPQDGRISPRDLCKALGVRLNQVQYAINEGKLEGCYFRDEKGRYRIDAELAKKRWAEQIARPPVELTPEQRAARAAVEGGAARAATLDDIDELLGSKNIRAMPYQEAKRLELILKAKKSKIEYDILAGHRVLRTVVEKEAFAAAKQIREALTALPARMRQQGLDAAMARLLEAEIDLVLKELADEK